MKKYPDDERYLRRRVDVGSEHELTAQGKNNVFEAPNELNVT